MAEILTQDEINQLLVALGPDEKGKFFKKHFRPKRIQLSSQDNTDLLKILSQNEIDNLLDIISGVSNKTFIDKIIWKLKKSKIVKIFRPPVKPASDGELSPEEIEMLLNPINKK